MTAQDLKNSILQQAVQGKLLPQNPADEPASELLKKIFAERQKLIDEDKIKNPPQLPPISDDEKPFDIPDNWQWVRLANIVSVLGDGIHGTPNFDFNGEYFFINGNNLVDGKIVIKDDTKKISKEEYQKYKKPLATQSILLSINGSIGHTAYYCDEPIILGKSACYFNLMEHVCKEYINFILKTKFFLDYAGKKSTQTTIKNLSLKMLRLFPLPLPPLAEQKRIVEKLEEILPLIERYGELEQRLTKLDKEFPDKLKKSLLQQAIQGKLTRQLSTDGDAKDLLEKIQSEKLKLIAESKIKKEKPLPPISDDEKPFDIPYNWEWVRLGEIINLISGQDLSLDCHNTEGKGVPYITGASNIIDEKIIINRWTTSPTIKAEYGDLLLSCKGTVGKVAFLRETSAHIARQIMAIKITNLVDKFYIKFFVEENVQKLKNQAKSMIPGISRNNLLILPLPLPPLAEQKRIVEKLEELLPLCDRLREKFTD